MLIKQQWNTNVPIITPNLILVYKLHVSQPNVNDIVTCFDKAAHILAGDLQLEITSSLLTQFPSSLIEGVPKTWLLQPLNLTKSPLDTSYDALTLLMLNVSATREHVQMMKVKQLTNKSMLLKEIFTLTYVDVNTSNYNN